MPRPKCCPKVDSSPRSRSYKPQGIPMSELVEVMMSLEELEAMRLVDMERMSQADAATRMCVSQPTLCRLLSSGRGKAAEALVGGKAITIAEAVR